jgi:hypothetical protein
MRREFGRPRKHVIALTSSLTNLLDIGTSYLYLLGDLHTLEPLAIRSRNNQLSKAV